MQLLFPETKESRGHAYSERVLFLKIHASTEKAWSIIVLSPIRQYLIDGTWNTPTLSESTGWEETTGDRQSLKWQSLYHEGLCSTLNCTQESTGNQCSSYSNEDTLVEQEASVIAWIVTIWTIWSFQMVFKDYIGLLTILEYSCMKPTYKQKFVFLLPYMGFKLASTQHT